MPGKEKNEDKKRKQVGRRERSETSVGQSQKNFGLSSIKEPVKLTSEVNHRSSRKTKGAQKEKVHRLLNFILVHAPISTAGRKKEIQERDILEIIFSP